MTQSFRSVDLMNAVIDIISTATGIKTVYANSSKQRPEMPYAAVLGINMHHNITVDVIEHELFTSGVQIEVHSSNPYDAQDRLNLIRKTLYRQDSTDKLNAVSASLYDVDDTVDNTILANQTYDYNFLFTATFLVRDDYTEPEEFKTGIDSADVTDDSKK